MKTLDTDKETGFLRLPVILAVIAGFIVGFSDPGLADSQAAQAVKAHQQKTVSLENGASDGMAQNSRQTGDHAVWMAAATMVGSGGNDRSFPQLALHPFKSLGQIAPDRSLSIGSTHHVSSRLGRRFTLVGAKPSGTS